MEMSFIRWAELYMKILPLPVAYSTLVGIDTGAHIKNMTPTRNAYSTLIGYTGIGILTGLTFPISYPLFAGYVLFSGNSEQK